MAAGGGPLSHRALALGLFALWLLVAGLATAFAIRNEDWFEAVLGPGLLVLAAVGLGIALQRPRNAVGWLALVIPLLAVCSGANDGYVALEEDPAGLRFGEYAVWFGNWFYYLWLGLIGIALPLLFPAGRLPSPRWRIVAWAGVAAVLLATLSRAFGVERIELDEDESEFPNPLAVPGAVGRALEASVGLSDVAFAAVVLASLAGLVLRLRRARGAERQQLKWFAYVGALLLLGLVAAGMQEAAGAPALVGWIGWSVFLFGLLLGLPAAIAFAVLRYRLYDIDVVVNRTLVYGSVTAFLAGAYLGLVLLFQLLLDPVTDGNGIAIALSTLAVAALFRPARRRVQELVDRRFYRSRYDAQLTLEGFSARLREEVDLDALRAELTRVAAETVQPAHVSLWLREVHR